MMGARAGLKLAGMHLVAGDMAVKWVAGTLQGRSGTHLGAGPRLQSNGWHAPGCGGTESWLGGTRLEAGGPRSRMGGSAAGLGI